MGGIFFPPRDLRVATWSRQGIEKTRGRDGVKRCWSGTRISQGRGHADRGTVRVRRGAVVERGEWSARAVVVLFLLRGETFWSTNRSLVPTSNLNEVVPCTKRVIGLMQ